MKPTLAIAALALLPTAPWAEGAVLTLACRATSVCQQGGQCAPANTDVIFVISPVSADADGMGDYSISYGFGEFAMKNVTGVGPMLWSEGNSDAQVLLVTSETTLLWQRFNAADVTSELTFLTCEAIQ